MSYQIHCPNCNTVIPPENINVQKTIAACANCGAVFNFEDNVPSLQKIKRRKTKKPDYMTLIETDDQLELKMPLLTTTSYKVLMAFFAVLMGGFYAFIAREALLDAELTELIVFSVIMLPFIVSFLASYLMRQSITSDSEHLKYVVDLLGIPLYKRVMNNADVVDVTAEEMSATRESVAEARYNLYADKIDKRQDMFVQNIPEAMAIYAQQALSNYLKPQSIDEHLRLQDELADIDEDVMYEESDASQSVMNK